MAEAETRCAARWIVFVREVVAEVGGKSHKAILAFFALSPMHVFFAQAIAGYSVARRPIVERSFNVTIAGRASSTREIVKIILASVTLIAIHTIMTVTLASIVALFRLASIGVASARNAAPVFILEEAFFAQFAFRAGGIVLTIDAAAVAELVVVNARIGEPVTVALFAFFGVIRSRAGPRRVVVQWQALSTVWPGRVMLAVANWLSGSGVLQRFFRVPVAFHPAANSEIGDCVVIRLEYFRAAEDLVAKSVQPNERDSNIRRGDPFLKHWRSLEICL